MNILLSLRFSRFNESMSQKQKTPTNRSFRGHSVKIQKPIKIHDGLTPSTTRPQLLRRNTQKRLSFETATNSTFNESMRTKSKFDQSVQHLNESMEEFFKRMEEK